MRHRQQMRTHIYNKWAAAEWAAEPVPPIRVRIPEIAGIFRKRGEYCLPITVLVVWTRMYIRRYYPFRMHRDFDSVVKTIFRDIFKIKKKHSGFSNRRNNVGV